MIVPIDSTPCEFARCLDVRPRQNPPLQGESGILSIFSPHGVASRDTIFRFIAISSRCRINWGLAAEATALSLAINMKSAEI